MKSWLCRAFASTKKAILWAVKNPPSTGRAKKKQRLRPAGAKLIIPSTSHWFRAAQGPRPGWRAWYTGAT